MITCNGCGASYEPLQRGELRYFHQCPPLSDAEIAAALGLPADPALRSKGDQAAIAKASRARPNGRNENAPSTAPAIVLIEGVPQPAVIHDWPKENARRDTEMISAGAGVTTIDDTRDAPHAKP